MAFKLSSRILTPLNSVAQNLREVAYGNLQARASAGEHAQGETAQLVHDFNTLAERLESVTREQQFWNAAVAYELRTPLTILRGRLQGLAEGVFDPAPGMFEGLLRQVEGLGRLVEDLRVLNLKDSQHMVLDLALTDLAQDVSTTVQTLAGSLQARVFHAQLDLEQASVVCDGFRIRQALTALH